MFDPDFRTARPAQGTPISFTEAESSLLRYLARHPRQVLSRDQILNAVSTEGSDKNDRSIDYLINRIRRKLDDSPRDPRFIATRYGGGYIWVAEKVEQPPQGLNDAFAVIGEFRGLETLNGADATAKAVANALADALRDELDSDQSVIVESKFRSFLATTSTQPPIQIELVFFRDSHDQKCLITCRSGASGRVFLADRVDLGICAGPVSTSSLNRLATRICHGRWSSDVEYNLSTTPLPVAMKEAADNGSARENTFTVMAPKLRALRAAHPDDPHIKLIYATYIHSNHIVSGIDLALNAPDQRVGDLAEIERLTLDALDYSQTQPNLAMTAAKLLYFVDHGYKSLALDLTRKAHRENTAIASSLAMIGQLLGFLGETDTAIDYLKQADMLTRRGTDFESYVLIMLCQVLIADNRRTELEPYRARVYELHPLLRVFIEPLFTDPDRPSLRAKGAMMVMSKARSAAYLSHAHFVWARLCQNAEHKANALRAITSLAVRRHGRAVVPQEIITDVPQLFI